MKIRRDGFVFRVATLMGDRRILQQDRVNGCDIFWRFALGVVLLIVGNLGIWIFIAMVVPTACFVRVLYFIGGKKFVRNRREFEKWQNGDLFVGADFSNRFEGKYYTVVPITWIPTFRGFRIVPIYFLAAPFLIFWLLMGAEMLTHFVVLLATGPYPYLRMLVALFAAGYALGWLYRRFVVGSEAHTLFFAWLKAKREGICPIVDIVDD